jgi:hypothetical protein
MTDTPGESGVTNYGRVMVVWVVVLLALYAFQQYFS